jgi:predicted Fe-S protein YdhL (DUF1289 family)
MSDLPIRPDTPCVAVCSTTFDEICRGCGRTVVEVAHWVAMTPNRRSGLAAHPGAGLPAPEYLISSYR